MSKEDSDSVKDAAASLSGSESDSISGKSDSESVSKGISGGIPKSKGDLAKGAASMAASKAPESVQKASATAADVGQKVAAVKSFGSSALGVIKGIGSGLFALFGNPIGWIICGIVIIIVLVMAFIPLIGRNENADGCYGVGKDVTVSADDKGDWKKNATSVADWMMSTKFKSLDDKPMSREQAVGIIGNMRQESQVDPKITQNNFIDSKASNQEIIALGDGGGKAIGLLQADGSRRKYFAEYAEKKGKHWSDMGIQIEWLKLEFDGTAPYPDGGYNKDQVLKQGFDKEGKDIPFYVEAWEKGFTRAGEPNMSARIKFAEEFNKLYKPGTGSGFGSSESGGSCLRDKDKSGGNVNTSDAVEIAISMSYPTTPESKVPSGDSYGKTVAKQEYKDAKKKAEQKTDKDPLGDLYASCDRFVTTVVRLTMDPKIPWGNTASQQVYLSKSPKWEKYEKKSEAKPGDIWITKTSGHVIFYVGDHKGKPTIAHASYLDRVAGLGDASYLNDNMVDTSGRAYYGYRFIGDKPKD